MVSTKITTLAVLALAAADAAVSTIVVTKPVASTVGQGGQALEVQWQDDGQAPDSAAWGRVNIFLATGSRNVQYKLQQLATGVAYGLNDATYPIDASVGPNGGYYFLRFEGTNTTGSATGIPQMSFSARFTLQGMTGQFNSTVMAQLADISGTGSASVASAASSSSSSSNFYGFSPTSTLSASGSASTSKSGFATSASAAASTASSASSAKSTSPASSNKVSYVTGLLGLAAAGLAFL